MVSEVAPACPISRSQIPAGQPIVLMPSIPPATPSIPALVHTVNQLRLAVLRLAGMMPGLNNNSTSINLQPLIMQLNANVGPQSISGQGAASSGGGRSKSPPAGDWMEVNRTTEKVRVHNPDDDTQFVDILRINSLTMMDRSTGETWIWRR